MFILRGRETFGVRAMRSGSVIHRNTRKHLPEGPQSERLPASHRSAGPVGPREDTAAAL